MRKGVKASKRKGKREGRRETKGKKRKKGKEERKDNFGLYKSFVIPKQPLTIKILIYTLKSQSMVNSENR